MKSLAIASMSLLLTLTLATSCEAYGAERLTFGEISATGSGCPQGTVTTVTTPDQSTVSLLFDTFNVQVPQYDGDNDNSTLGNNRFDERVSHKSCHIIVNAKLPEGERLEGLDILVDFRGDAFVEEGSRAFFKSDLLEWRGPSHSRGIKRHTVEMKEWAPPIGRGPLEGPWQATKEISVQARSNCAHRGERDVRFVLNNSLHAQINPRRNSSESSALLTLDTADMSGVLRLKLQTRPCNAPSVGGAGNRPTPTPTPTPPGRGPQVGRPARPCPPGLVGERGSCRPAPSVGNPGRGGGR